MVWVRALGVAACVLLVCTCSSSSDDRAAAFDPQSTECEAGARACVEATVAEMTTRLSTLLESCDHNSVFALTYLRTTEEFLRTIDDPGSFSDVGYMVREDALFASFYFDAYDAWQSGRAAEVPQAWKIAFDAAQSAQVTGIGDALLGISAHVNRDLPFVLERLGLVTADGTSREADHDRINGVLSRVMSPMMAEASSRLDPTIADRQVGGQSFDDAQALRFIAGWRDNAWSNAERLVSARTPAARAAVAAEIEAEAATTSGGLLAATSASTEDQTARGDWCLAHRGG